MNNFKNLKSVGVSVVDPDFTYLVISGFWPLEITQPQLFGECKSHIYFKFLCCFTFWSMSMSFTLTKKVEIRSFLKASIQI
jgi:hypothetical protein